MNRQFTNEKCKRPIKHEKCSSSLGIIRTLTRYNLSSGQFNKDKKNDNAHGMPRDIISLLAVR